MISLGADALLIDDSCGVGASRLSFIRDWGVAKVHVKCAMIIEVQMKTKIPVLSEAVVRVQQGIFCCCYRKGGARDVVRDEIS